MSEMNRIQEAFISIIREALCDSTPDDPKLKPEEWIQLFHLAFDQEVLPLVYDAARDCPSAGKIAEWDRSEASEIRERAVGAGIRQIIQTNEFLTLLLHAQERGLNPIVLKGVVCRSLYPKPMLRPSVDEDLLILPEETKAWHRFLLEKGLYCDQENADSEESAEAAELTYHKEGSPISLEIHKHFFEPSSRLFEEMNQLFSNTGDDLLQIEDVTVRTIAPTDHLLFLILHAYKHFLYSGVGVRTVCDIGMFTEAYAERIDWDRICSALESVRALYFAKALYRILHLYLMPQAQFDTCIAGDETIDVDPLLNDILAGGVHGDSSLARLHSSNMTLTAVESESPDSGSILKSVFLPLKALRGRYPYLKKAPFLLPVAWVQRIVHYLKETRRSKGGAVSESAESIRLGRERVKLLEKYHII